MRKTKISVDVLSQEHLTYPFSCGEIALDDYLKKYALENSNRGVSRAFVAMLQEPKILIGYYTLSSAQVEHSELPKNQQRGLPRYPVPAICIGRLALNISYQGLGYGAALLVDALRRIVKVSTHIGIRLILVNAKHDKSKLFYQKFGFLELPEHPLKLILPMKTAMLIVRPDTQKSKTHSEILVTA